MQTRQQARQGQKSHKKLWWPLGIIIVFLILFSIWGFQHYSKQNQINTFITGVRNNQDKNITNNLAVKDNDVKVNARTIKPLVNYYQQHPSQLTDLKRDLQANGKNDQGFKVVEQGRIFLLFPHYKVEATAVRPTIKSNHSNAEVSVDGQTVGKTNEDNQVTAPAQMPGFHTFDVDLKLSGHQLNAEKQTDIFANQDKVKLPLKLISFKAKGIPNAEVYVNGKKVGVLGPNGSAEINNVPIDDDSSTYLKLNQNNQKTKSEEHELSMKDNHKTINYKFANVATKGAANELLTNVWRGVSAVTNDNKSLDDVGIDNLFVDGKNAPAYHALADLVNQNHEHKINYGEITLKVDSTQSAGKMDSTVIYQIDANVNDDNNSGKQTTKYRAVIERDNDGNFKLKTNDQM